MDMAYSNGKIAVITGAGSGIGQALARALNREGCRLLLCDNNEKRLVETVQSLSRSNVQVQTRVIDVANKSAMQGWANDITSEHGHVDIVINNAGVATGAPVEETKYEDIEWLMGINFWGVVYGTMEFLPLLRKAPQGHLVNISSIFGMVGIPTQSAYNAAKFAVRGYTEALRLEMADSNVMYAAFTPEASKPILFAMHVWMAVKANGARAWPTSTNWPTPQPSRRHSKLSALLKSVKSGY